MSGGGEVYVACVDGTQPIVVAGVGADVVMRMMSG